MTIRTFQVGDDVAQVSIYNEVGSSLPNFKPATVDEVRRRCHGPDFDPTARFYALSNGKPVGYVTFQVNGRVSYPWCRRGHESLADELLEHCLAQMKQRGMTTAFAAYRTDWTTIQEWFLARGFLKKREMINYVLDLVEMPTPAARLSSSITSLYPSDVPALLRLGPNLLQLTDPHKLQEYLFHNPYFSSDALFALRSKSDDTPVAVGILITNPSYANPKLLDAAMPCFRLGAFGTEGYTTKRVNGLISILAADTRDLTPCALDLLGHATNLLQETDVETFAAQVPSDAEHLVRFYKSLFRRQGSFPILERRL